MIDDGGVTGAIRDFVTDHVMPEVTPELLAGLRYHRFAPIAFEAGLSEALRGAATEAAARDLASHLALRDAAAVLAAEGLDFLLFKGIALGSQIYGRSDLRPREDIDILLDGWDAVERAEHAFVQRGWRSAPRLPGRFVAHAATVARRGQPSLDLHARPSQRHRVAQALPFAELFTRRVLVELPVLGPAPTLRPADALLAGALHLFAHHGAQVAPLIWLEDLARLAMCLDDRDWRAVLDRALEHELGAAFGRAMAELRWWSGVHPPQFVLNQLVSVFDASIVYVDRPTPVALFIDDMLVLEPTDAGKLLGELVWPSGEFLATRAGVSRPRPYPLLWGDRVLRTLAARAVR